MYQEEACTGLVDLISHCPPLTRLLLNSWMWGYEHILKAMGRALNSQVRPIHPTFHFRTFFKTLSQIHVDRYKHVIYSGISHPSLSSLLTREAASTRFH